MAKLTEGRIAKLEGAAAAHNRAHYEFVDLWPHPDGSDRWATTRAGTDYAPRAEHEARYGPYTVFVCHAR